MLGTHWGLGRLDLASGSARDPQRVKRIGSGSHLGSGRLRRGDAELG
jgi:hypothetical protein